MSEFGLTTEQVIESQARHGNNKLTEIATEGFWDKFKDNLGDPMIKILCVALAVNILLVILGQTEWYETVGIAIAVALATFISTFSEHRNENAFQKLQEEASQITIKTYRNGGITEVPIDELVVGDAVLLQPGDKIPADGVLVDGEIRVDQSVLNGEAKEALKKVMPEGYKDEDSAMDFLNEYKVFRGSVVCLGNAVMTVTVVGDKSVYGQIAKELQEDDDRDTPLKVKLRKLAQSISVFGYIGGVAIAAALLFQRIMSAESVSVYFSAGWEPVLKDVVQAIMLAVVIIVMAVPEGLPTMIAIVSALNMRTMLKDNVLVRKIAGIETAGSLNILFSDKTGTITKGELETVAFISGCAKEYKTIGEIEEGLAKLIQISIRNNTDAMISGEDENTKIIGGNATERAVLGYIMPISNAASEKVINKIPFNSANKYSASQITGDYNLTLIKGAPEKLLDRCKYYYDAGGNETALTDMSAIIAKIDELSVRAIRVLALATCKEQIKDDTLPSGEWTLVGILGIRDDIRAESMTAIREVQNAGVQVVMITGDRKETAVAIAKEVGLLQADSDIVLTSDELAKTPDDELKKKLPDLRVIARALPSDKSRLVRVSQSINLVVGMTGDGVNDSPALKAADVGFAMGSGTEVAKEASDIIIMDDNFSSIDKAILYGRTIFNSIRKFITFQLTINLAAVIVSFVFPLLGMPNPLTITQILWLNLVMDTLGALAFGGEPALKRFMQEKPKRRDESIVNGYMWSSIITVALCVFISSVIFLLDDVGLNVQDTVFRVYNVPANAPEHVTPDLYLLTGFFAFFIFLYVFNAFNVRTDRLNILENISLNKGFLFTMLLIVVVQITMVYIGREMFRGYGLVVNEWLFVIGLAFLIIPVDLLRKVIFKTLSKGQ